MSLKSIKKGDSVLLKGFTGMVMARMEVTAANDTKITVTKTNGDKLVFSRKTGIQVNVAEGKEKYANSIIEDDPAWKRNPTPRRKKKSSAKKSVPKAVPEDTDDVYNKDEELDDE